MGWMMSPAGLRDPKGLPFALDNGMYHAPDCLPVGMKGLPHFYRMLERAIGWNPMFVTVPDVPYRADESRLLSRKHKQHIMAEFGEMPLAVAVQDGAIESDLDGYQWVFVGGSTDWKWSTARWWSEAAKKRGMNVHIARVNTHERIQHCIDIGADSADGTGIWRGDRGQLARVVAALTQEGLWGQRAGAVGVA